MKKNRYLILIAVLLSVVGTMIVLPQRLRNEANWKDVAVVCDWQDIETVSIRTGLPWEQILDEIKKVGVSTIGVSDYDLKNLQQLGKVVPAPIPHGFSPTLRYFAVSDPTLRKTMQNQLILFGKIFQETGNSIFGTNVSYEEEDRIGLGWNMDLINSCYEKGFRIILRPRNWQGITPEVLRGLLADPVYEKAKGLVFFGDQILGNGNAATLAEMASFLKTRNLFWGYTEFVGQKGETTLANLVPEQTVRIHSVPPDELKNYTPAEAKERFIRAVKERSIRLLYVRFFTEPSYDLWGKNITYLRSIIQDLNESGYSWGTVSPLKPFSPPFSVLILFALSVACASAVLYDFFLPGKWVILILVALLEIGSFFTGRLTGMKVMGVLAGMIFPTLALFILIEGFQKKGKEIMVLFSALAMATAGGLVVSQDLDGFSRWFCPLPHSFRQFSPSSSRAHGK
ncbi:MAG: DUF5693 family protein [Candidatus Atribacteria bacterium]|nr:DUF5693 family protein [Candidatus Atribacteria bacterium]